MSWHVVELAITSSGEVEIRQNIPDYGDIESDRVTMSRATGPWHILIDEPDLLLGYTTDKHWMYGDGVISLLSFRKKV
ncbi:MAG TPA: hypothetical protein VIV09_14610 [Pseudolabrys sp.]